VSRFAVALTGATRSPEAAGIADVGRYVEFGASPRGSIALVVAGRALALIRGRDYVLPQDVVDLSHDVLRHRLVLSYEAIATGVAEDALIDAALAAVQVPQLDVVGRAA
jgi:MoxR-like ATPase